MSYISNLLNEARDLKFVDSVELFNYFLTNFKNNKDIATLISPLTQMVMDITNKPEQRIVREMEGKAFGQKSYTFFFKENDKLYGIFDLDFIFDDLANFRCQLFVRGFFSKRKLNQKYEMLENIITKQYGESSFDPKFDRLMWIDNNKKLVFTLRKVKSIPIVSSPSISVTITERRFSGI